VQWKEEKQQLEKKKEEEAKAEEDFCCCRASTLFSYSSVRPLSTAAESTWKCWHLILLPPNPNFVSYIHPRSKGWQRGSTSLSATEDEIQKADSSKYFGLWRFRE
jgi:hypothetical protein